jgi:hypothetical protein
MSRICLTREFHRNQLLNSKVIELNLKIFNFPNMADGGFLEHDVTPRIFLQLLTDARLLAMGISMKDIFRKMLAKDAYSNAKAEVVTEMNVTPISLEELDLSVVVPGSLEQAVATDDLFVDLHKFKTVLAKTTQWLLQLYWLKKFWATKFLKISNTKFLCVLVWRLFWILRDSGRFYFSLLFLLFQIMHF